MIASRQLRSTREKLTDWLDGAIVLFGLAAVAWTMGKTLATLASKGGWMAAILVVGLLAMTFLWFWWSAWPRRIKLFCGVLFLVVVAVPLVEHYG